MATLPIPDDKHLRLKELSTVALVEIDTQVEVNGWARRCDRGSEGFG
jgi:hypothetical protein